MPTANEMRNNAVELMLSRKGRNSYTQGAKRGYFFGYPDNVPGSTVQKGYSDCSSAVRAAIRAASGIDIGSNTSAQVANRAKIGMVVHETTGCYPDESRLLPGDCLYFKGNTGHTLDVGHVEMYIGGGKICGHGSGTGPKVRNMKNYCASRSGSKKRYFMAVRWILDGNQSANEADGDSCLKIAPGSWNVRTGPGTNYGSAGIVKGGSTIRGLECDGWIPVEYGGRPCFISAKAVLR